ncbi:MAG: PAS domain-containing protein, partial [Myxococcales bacterium]|nr:PAS domain-containing protein [Myxococcales bacterium]
MRNLLNSTEVATLFLDGELRIQRFTRETTRVANLIQADIGRPIGDLSNKLEYEQLEDDAREVLRTLVFKQVVVRSQDGAWLQVRIMPYRTSDDRISGVVITFFDVTRFHELELALDDERAAWVAAVEASPDADALVDPHGRAVAASAGFWTAVGASAGETRARSLGLLGPAWAAPDVLAALEAPDGATARLTFATPPGPGRLVTFSVGAGPE